jgi:hypothetical protein
VGSVSPQMAGASSWSRIVQGNADASCQYTQILAIEGCESCKEWIYGRVNAGCSMTVLYSLDISGIVYINY